MTAITVTVAATQFPSYITVTDASTYLLADVERFAAWAARSADEKGRGLASATRLLQRLKWAAGTAPPTDETAPAAVSQACALLAADMLTQPDLFSNPSSASNIKSAGAGPAKVEFFRPVDGTPLPQAAFDLISALLGSGATVEGLYGYAGGTDFPSRFDCNEYKPDIYQ